MLLKSKHVVISILESKENFSFLNFVYRTVLLIEAKDRFSLPVTLKP